MPQAPTVAIPKRLPLVVTPENRGDDVRYDSRLINCFMEQEDNGEMYIYERPGLDESTRPPAGAATGRGIYNWRGVIYSVFGNRFYVGTTATGAAIDTTNGVYRWSQSLGATPRLQLGNGVLAYNYDAGGGLVQITDINFPAAFVKGWAYLDGTTYIMTPTAHILGSDINDTPNWDSLNDILAQVEPDQGMAVAKQLVYVIAFKQWTTEVFYDAGNSSGSPLGAVQGAKIDYGCAHADSVQDVNGTLCWLASVRDAGLQVVAFSKLKAEVISTPAIDRLLQNADIDTVYSWQIKVGTHHFYVLTIKNENLTLACDITTKGRPWHQWTDADGNYFPIVASTFSPTYQSLLQHETNGRIYVADMSYTNDDGALIQVDIYTPVFDGGTRRRKMLTLLELVGDQQPGSIIQVRHNDHDYDPTKWSNFRSFDMTQKRPFITDCGTFVRRAHNLRHRANVRMPRLSAAEMQVDLGTL